MVGGKRVYIATSFANREGAREARDVLLRKGYDVQARWIDNHLAGMDNMTEREIETEADQDIEDVIDADILVFILNKDIPSVAGGQHVEFGVAAVLEKAIYLIGEPNSIFHYLHNVRVFDSIESIPEPAPMSEEEMSEYEPKEWR